MYSVKLIAMTHKTYTPDHPSCSDILDIIRYNNNSLGSHNRYVIVKELGEFYTLQQCKKAVQDVPSVYFDYYLDSTFNKMFIYVWEGVVIYEDGRAILCYNEKPI